VIVHQLLFCLVIVKNLEEQHPSKLRDSLRVSVNPGVFTHDVLDGFNGCGYGHLNTVSFLYYL
jgi:hypothetical protein